MLKSIKSVFSFGFAAFSPRPLLLVFRTTMQVNRGRESGSEKESDRQNSTMFTSFRIQNLARIIIYSEPHILLPRLKYYKESGLSHFFISSYIWFRSHANHQPPNQPPRPDQPSSPYHHHQTRRESRSARPSLSASFRYVAGWLTRWFDGLARTRYSVSKYWERCCA